MFNNVGTKTKKILIVLLIITLTYSSFALAGKGIVKGLISYAEDGEEIRLKDRLISNQNLITNKVYEINGEQKRVVQIELETGINSKDYPIKETNITLKTNILSETLEDVKVTSLNKNSYTDGTWTLEGEEVKINLSNSNETLTEKKQGTDKLLVTYIFQYNKDEEVTYIENALKKVEVKTYEKGEASRTFTGGRYEDIDLENDILSLSIENKDIHKTTIKDATVVYEETLNLDFGYRKNISTYIIEDEINDIYGNDEVNTEVTSKYVKTVINKANLLYLLGDEGTLTIKDSESGKVLANITKEYIEGLKADVRTEHKVKDEESENEELRSYITSSENNVTIEYAVEASKLQVKFENIAEQSTDNILDANFEIKNEKEISNITDLTKIDYLTEKVKYTVNEAEKEVESKITFKDTITRAKLEIDNDKWVLGKANKINFKITLDTNTEKSELYKNPTFIIELPASVSAVNRENSSFTLANDNGAFINKLVYVTSVLGKQYVVIMLNGEQTPETVLDGNTEINLALELVLKENEESTENTKMYYQNSTVTAYESGTGFDSCEVGVSLILENNDNEVIDEQPAQPTQPENPETPEEPENIFVTLRREPEDKIVRQGDKIEYWVNIDNFEEEKQNNVKFTDVIPEGLTFKKVNLMKYDTATSTYKEQETNYKYDEKTRILSVEIPELEKPIESKETDAETNEEITTRRAQTTTLKITVETNKLEEGIYSKQIENKAEIELENGEKYTSKTDTVTISDAFISMTAKVPENVKENEEIEIEVNIKNDGLLDGKVKKLKLNIPEEITNLSLEYGIVDSEEGKGEVTIISNEYSREDILVPAGKTFCLKIKGIAQSVEAAKQVEIKLTLDDTETKWNTEITDEPGENPDNPENPDGPKDPTNPDNPENPDGPKDPTNPDNPENPDGPKDPTNPDNPENPDGPKDPTNPDNPENPDGPKDPTNPDNPENPDGPKDPTNPDNPSEPSQEGFDLSLKAYINKITVTNAQGTTVYNYDKANFAKIEIPRKQMNGTTVALEYKIIVKNEGTVEGYARKIADYLPEGLKFNSEINKDWYLAEDGNIYSVALADKLLKPGETSELTIVLTKQMTNENQGTIKNIMEIYETSNEQNLEDINSVPGDKVEGENDMSTVEVLITVATGTTILYISLTLGVLVLIGLGIYEVKKVALNKKGGC